MDFLSVRRLNAALFVLIAGVLFGAAAPANAQLVDRLLVNVDSRHYGQRQFELYMALESLLFTDSQRWRVDAPNWDAKLARFVTHMLVDSSARTLETFNARPEEIDVAERKLDRIKGGKWQAFLAELGYSTAAVAAERDRVIRVAKFVCHRLRLSGGNTKSSSLSPSSCQEGQAIPDLSKDYSWFARIVKETPYRVYEGAKTYKAILPYPTRRGSASLPTKAGRP